MLARVRAKPNTDRETILFMSEENSRGVNQQTGAAIPPARGEITDGNFRKYPFIVP